MATHSEEHASNRRRTRKTQNLGPQEAKENWKIKENTLLLLLYIRGCVVSYSLACRLFPDKSSDSRWTKVEKMSGTLPLKSAATRSRSRRRASRLRAAGQVSLEQQVRSVKSSLIARNIISVSKVILNYE